MNRVGKMAALAIPLVLLMLGAAPAAEQAESPNLALEAKASASESYQALTPEKANDGNAAPGHGPERAMRRDSS
jgi:hypothetical protein